MFEAQKQKVQFSNLHPNIKNRSGNTNLLPFLKEKKPKLNKALLYLLTKQNLPYIDMFLHEIERLQQDSFDPGCNSTHEWRQSGTRNTEVELPVEVLNRNTITDLILCIVEGSANRQNCKIIFFDGKNVKNADDCKDDENRPYANVLINKIARTTNHVISQILEKSNCKAQLGRWGGDEFVCVINGENAEKLSAEFVEKLQTALSNETGWYKMNDQYIQLPLGLKDKGGIETINIPETGEKLTVFKHFLRKGLILKDKDIQNIINEMHYFEIDSIDEYINAIYSNEIYPSGVVSEEHKIQFIKSKSPAYGEILDSVYKNPIVLNTNNQLHPYETIISYWEKTIFNPSLKEPVGSFTNMFKQLLEEPIYKHVVTFELKFIKEINEICSYIDADLLIFSLWDKIRAVFNAAGCNPINNYQRGGTSFHVFDCVLDTSILQLLQSLNSVDFNRKHIIFDILARKNLINIDRIAKIQQRVDAEQSTVIPIGFGETKIAYSRKRNPNTTETSVKAGLNSMFEISELSWYMNLFRAIVNKIDDSVLNETEFSKLLYSFTTQKRGADRLNLVFEYLDTIPQEAPDLIENMALLKKIFNNYKLEQIKINS